MNQKGFTLIETLVGSAILLILALSTYKAFGVLMDAVSLSRAKIAATSIANEKFEIIRNLPYNDVGIIGGLPIGKIERNQIVVRDNYSFNITNTIRNIDDLFDGTIGGNPSDLSPADYKSVDLEISCSNCKIFSPLKFTTIIAPHSLETASSNGALFIKVFDKGGLPIQGVTVNIVNTQANPDININETTDNEGWVKIIDAPPGTNAYNITATKLGYSQDQTYPIGGAAGPDPLLSDATVVIQQVTQPGLSIDRTSSLAVATIDSACLALPNIGFSLTGTKLIGEPSVLKYPTQNFTTDASGNYTFPSLEWNSYQVLLTSGLYDLAGTSLLPTFAIDPNENKSLQLVVVPHLEKALLVSVKDQNNSAIDGATVNLVKGIFDETKTTNSGACTTPGEVFWNGLEGGVYTLTVSKTGYQTSITNNLSISSSWQNQNIVLTP
jgi:prepilin-type N-terminal cleavage/methylation domain-containing protein